MNFKSVADLARAIKGSQNPPQIILVFGNQFDNLEKIRQELSVQIAIRLGMEPDPVSLNGAETEAATFHAELSTIPMFGNPRLILVRHADNILKKIASNKTILGYFIRDLASIFEKTFLLIQVESQKLPSAFEDVFKNAAVLEEPRIRSQDIPDLVRSKVHTMGFEISPDAVTDLTHRYSLNPALVVKALDRLFLYCLNEKKITPDDIRDLAFDSEGDFLFEIIDFIAQKNINRAAALLEKSDFGNSAGFMAMISKLFTDAYRYSNLKKLGVGVKEAHERLELNTRNTFIFRKNEDRFRQMLSAYTESDLVRHLDELMDLDKGIKENSSADLQKNLILMFIFSLEGKVA